MFKPTSYEKTSKKNDVETSRKLTYASVDLSFHERDSDDFQSLVVPAQSCQQKGNRVTRSQTKELEKSDKKTKSRTKNCVVKAKNKVKRVDHNDNEKRPAKRRRRKSKVCSDVGTISKEERVATRLKFNARKSELKVGDLYIKPHEHFHCRIGCHTETDIVDIMNKSLTGRQLEMFRNSCFGYFLDLPLIKTQNQLIHCLLLREVVPGVERELWVKLNDTILSFGIGDFGVITGLKCVDDDATVYDKPSMSRLLKEYFSECKNETITREQLLARFKKKEWKSDDDAFKMALMVFIHHFLFSHSNDHGINKVDFDIVESGEYQNFAWGKKCFEEILKTTRNKQCEYLSMYRLGGLPIAVQTWFYECCSTVHGSLAVRVGENVPRILNWRVTTSPSLLELTNDVIMPTIDKLKYTNILPTSEEKSKLNITSFFEDAKAVYISSCGAPEQRRSQNIEQQSKPSCDSSNGRDDLRTEVDQLRIDIQKLTGEVEVLNDYVVSSFEKIFHHLKIDKTKQTSEVPHSKAFRVNDDGGDTSGLGHEDVLDHYYEAAPSRAIS